jgi:hypothetical protein
MMKRKMVKRLKTRLMRCPLVTLITSNSSKSNLRIISIKMRKKKTITKKMMKKKTRIKKLVR